jgi:hypothetical protein
VAEALGVSADSIQRHRLLPELKVMRLGSLRLVAVNELERVVADKSNAYSTRQRDLHELLGFSLARSFGQSRLRGKGALPLASASSHVLSELSRDRARCSKA